MSARAGELARAHGVYGFCYYFYWFGGGGFWSSRSSSCWKTGSRIPFCLCWANEPWTRRWDGRERHPHAAASRPRRDLAILDDLMPFFEDPRYIRIDGRPLLLIYRQGLPDAAGSRRTCVLRLCAEGCPASTSATCCPSGMSTLCAGLRCRGRVPAPRDARP